MHTPFLLLPSFHSGSQPDYLDGGPTRLPRRRRLPRSTRRCRLPRQPQARHPRLPQARPRRRRFPLATVTVGAFSSHRRRACRPLRLAKWRVSVLTRRRRSSAGRSAKSTGTRTGGLTRSASSASCVTRSVTASLLGASTACRAGTAARSTRPSFPSASTATVSLRPPRTTSATPVVRITCALFGRSSPFFFFC